MSLCCLLLPIRLVTTDAGLLAYRELDEAIALTDMVQDTFKDVAHSVRSLEMASWDEPA